MKNVPVDSYIVLLCEECNQVYSAFHPPMAEIENPCCPTCRNRVREGCETETN